MNTASHTQALLAFEIRVNGIVQGVGFRPFVYRLACSLGLNGWVMNRNDGVSIHVQGDCSPVKQFLDGLMDFPPPASNIEHVLVSETLPLDCDEFLILGSQFVQGAHTSVSPDIAICDDCLHDMKAQAQRLDYPLINCTNCGPRYTIIQSLPYDRSTTSMRNFPMCLSCRKEYLDPVDRRFHAQPVGCNNCGPKYLMVLKNKVLRDILAILDASIDILQKGGVIALKGMGGFNLICDANNDEAVQQLRMIKGRFSKPFAVMFSCSASIAQYCALSRAEEAMLESWRRPIVLLSQTHPLAPAVNPGLDSLGVMLPNMALHYLLFEHSDIQALVCTSGNLGDEPILADDQEALQCFDNVVTAVVYHDRQILNPVDDSVCQFVDEKPQVLRRARGFVPEPIALPFHTEGIWAMGSDMKSTFAIGKGKSAILSPYFGDLEHYDVRHRYLAAMEHFSELFSFQAQIIVADKHPAYHSSILGSQKAEEMGCELIRVQHHHAHIASCMAEHKLDEKVIGVCFDGTGYGDDGLSWGSEFLFCNYHSYTRYAHFSYIPLPGGEQAIREPWRIAFAFLHRIYGSSLILEKFPFLNKVPIHDIEIIHAMLTKGINTPLSCGAGRLFDAVAALLGICSKVTFDGEAGIRLESLCHNPANCWGYEFGKESTIDVDQVIFQVLQDLQHHVAPNEIATRFHLGMASMIADKVVSMYQLSGIKKIVLSGGVFQNRFLLFNVLRKLENKGLSLFFNEKVPGNDGGLSLGQLAIAANIRNSLCV